VLHDTALPGGCRARRSRATRLPRPSLSAPSPRSPAPRLAPLYHLTASFLIPGPPPAFCAESRCHSDACETEGRKVRPAACAL
jgi:hypothetical protein